MINCKDKRELKRLLATIENIKMKYNHIGQISSNVFILR